MNDETGYNHAAIIGLFDRLSSVDVEVIKRSFSISSDSGMVKLKYVNVLSDKSVFDICGRFPTHMQHTRLSNIQYALTEIAHMVRVQDADLFFDECKLCKPKPIIVIPSGKKGDDDEKVKKYIIKNAKRNGISYRVSSGYDKK